MKNPIGFRRIRIAAAVAITAAMSLAQLGTPESARAQIQQSPNSANYLIQRFIPPSDQWAISYNFADGTLTGNVFKTDGGEPSFVWCTFVDVEYSADPMDNNYTLDCWGAGPCAEAPCTPEEWTSIGEGLPLPASFLLPEGTTSTFGGNVQPIFTQSCAFSGCHSGATPAAGLNLAEGVAYANIFEQPSSQSELNLVEPFLPEESYLYQKIIGGGSGAAMPPGGMLGESQIASVRAWIAEGAAEN